MFLAGKGIPSGFTLFAFTYFLLRYVYYFSYDLRILLFMESGENGKGTERRYSKEVPVLVLSSLGSISSAVAGRCLASPREFYATFAIASIFGIAAFLVLARVYPTLKVDGVPVSQIRARWLFVSILEILFCALAVASLSLPAGLKQNWIDKHLEIYGSVTDFDRFNAIGFVAMLCFFLLADIALSVDEGLMR